MGNKTKFKPMCDDGKDGHCVTWMFGYCNQCLDKGMIKMEFKRTTTTRATIKKMSKYTFEFKEEDIKTGKKSTPRKPHLCREIQDDMLFGLSMEKGKLRAVMYHSYDCFEKLTD